jgi:hypothetical protein
MQSGKLKYGNKILFANVAMLLLKILQKLQYKYMRIICITTETCESTQSYHLVRETVQSGIWAPSIHSKSA